MKNLAITDEGAKVLFVSESEYGSTHDKTIWDGIVFKFRDKNLLADLGFLGIEKDNPNVILPYKKTKNRELTGSQKEINRPNHGLRPEVVNRVEVQLDSKLSTFFTQLIGNPIHGTSRRGFFRSLREKSNSRDPRASAARQEGAFPPEWQGEPRAERARPTACRRAFHPGSSAGPQRRHTREPVLAGGRRGEGRER